MSQPICKKMPQISLNMTTQDEENRLETASDSKQSSDQTWHARIVYTWIH